MTITRSARPSDRLCSVFSAAHGEDPGGSAPSWKRCLVIELPKPWDSEVAETRHFPSRVSEALDKAEEGGLPTKLLCAAPDAGYSEEGHSRVILYSRPDLPFASFHKDEFMPPTEEVGPLVEALLEGSPAVRTFERYREERGNVRDLMVCTHGTHNVCCGTFGVPIYEALRSNYAPEQKGRLRVWQVSHFGGHRFAPNVVDLPEGRNWVRLGPDELDSVVHRNRPVSALRRHYRGWVGLDSPYEQVAEREVFMREGWDWTGRQVSAQLVKVADDQRQAEVRIDFTDQEGSPCVYEATVEMADSVTRVSCPNGEEIGGASQYTVSRLVRVS